MAQKGNDTTFKIGRDAGTGHFKSVPAARLDRQGSVVETIRRPAPPPAPKRK